MKLTTVKTVQTFVPCGDPEIAFVVLRQVFDPATGEAICGGVVTPETMSIEGVTIDCP